MDFSFLFFSVHEGHGYNKAVEDISPSLPKFSAKLEVDNLDRVPICCGCGLSIPPMKGTNDFVRVVAMDKDFHVDCYNCQVC